MPILICWLCDLYLQGGSYICSLICSYIQLMLYMELHIDNFYTYLPLHTHIYIYIDNLPMYTNNEITL